MLIAPEEYRLFADLVKRVVSAGCVGTGLGTGLSGHRKQPRKMRRPIGRMLEEARKRVAREALARPKKVAPDRGRDHRSETAARQPAR